MLYLYFMEEVNVEKRFENTVFIFSKVNTKRFMSLNYFEINTLSDIYLYMEEGMIVCFEETFYQYKGSHSYSLSERVPAIIEVKEGKKVIAKFNL